MDFQAHGQAAADVLFAFTGRALDQSTGRQNNLNGWCDAATGRWLSQEPLGYPTGDGNLYRYVGDRSAAGRDPAGLHDPAWTTE
ncbi:MAG: hypothetical protein H5U08_02760 [Thermogutta sp.]|nr:hypothetical protein [Thermogutta sp.]